MVPRWRVPRLGPRGGVLVLERGGASAVLPAEELREDLTQITFQCWLAPNRFAVESMTQDIRELYVFFEVQITAGPSFEATPGSIDQCRAAFELDFANRAANEQAHSDFAQVAPNIILGRHPQISADGAAAIFVPLRSARSQPYVIGIRWNDEVALVKGRVAHGETFGMSTPVSVVAIEP